MTERKTLRAGARNDLSWYVEINGSLRCDISAKYVFCLLENTPDLVLGQHDAHCWQPAAQIGFDHRFGAREPRRAALRCDSDACDTGFRK